jgi:surface polysaccharide O-acyltransferase-like enzyme
MTAKIFIPNKGGHDFTMAEHYGDLVYVTSGAISKFSVGTMAREWSRVLKDSKDTDYILLSSLTALCAIGTAMFARKHGCVNLLLYRNGKYISRRLLIDDLVEGILNEEG